MVLDLAPTLRGANADAPLPRLTREDRSDTGAQRLATYRWILVAVATAILALAIVHRCHRPQQAPRRGLPRSPWPARRGRAPPALSCS